MGEYGNCPYCWGELGCTSVYPAVNVDANEEDLPAWAYLYCESCETRGPRALAETKEAAVALAVSRGQQHSDMVAAAQVSPEWERLLLQALATARREAAEAMREACVARLQALRNEKARERTKARQDGDDEYAVTCRTMESAWYMAKVYLSAVQTPDTEVP